MFQTQKKYEEAITVVNESAPGIASGGIAVYTEPSSISIRAVVMPDFNVYRENRIKGRYAYEVVFAHVRKTEMDKVDMIPGRTKITWNGYTYKVANILDHRNVKLFKNAEIEMRRKIGVDGST